MTCPDCETHHLDCAARAKCLAHRGVLHLDIWGCCESCVAEIDRMLYELFGYHRVASHHVALAPRSSGDPGPMGAHRDPPPPLSIDALDLAVGEHMLGVLEEWEVWWRDTFALDAYGKASEARLSHGTVQEAPTHTSRTLEGVVSFLRAWWPRAATAVGKSQPSPEDFAQEVRELHRAALAALALTQYDVDPAAVEPFDWTIRCPADIDDKGTMCGFRIGMRRRPLSVDDRPLEPLTLNCEKCGAHWDASRLLLVAASAGTRVEVSVDDAMSHLGVSRATVYRMVSRGQVQRGAHGRIALGGMASRASL